MHYAEQSIILMDSKVPNGNVDLGVPPVPDEALGPRVVERLGAFRLDSCLEDLLMIQDNHTVSRWQI